jgi:hypothetical protein
MANQSETGHAKNVANFETLISVVNGFGAAYNPSKSAIKTTALTSLSTSAKTVMNQVNTAEGQYKIAVANRDVAFEPLSKLATRIINALRASDVSEQIIASAESLIRKLQGKRATPKKTEEEKAALLAEGTTVNEVSSSQMSFDNRLDSLDKVVNFLSNIPEYTPNEEELQIITLAALYTSLSALNVAAVQAETALNNMRMSRNELLYKTGTGMVDVALSVKTYVKSLFGATSAQYKQLSGLTFKDRG